MVESTKQNEPYQKGGSKLKSKNSFLLIMEFITPNESNPRRRFYKHFTDHDKYRNIYTVMEQIHFSNTFIKENVVQSL